MHVCLAEIITASEYRLIFDLCRVIIMLVYCLCAVLLDITGVMFNKKFMDEVFKPQEVYPKKSLRAILERFAHASVMRLNAASMDKVVFIIVINVQLFEKLWQFFL